MSKSNRFYRKVKYVVYRQTIVDGWDIFWTFVGGFSGIALIALLQQYLGLANLDHIFLIGSFGASAVLVYGASNSPLAQPRNLIGGHVLSALIGVTVYQLFPDILWLTASLSVSSSIVLMQITKTLHPPGGATALIATIGSAKVKALGFIYILTPVLSGVLILFFVALVVNNIPAGRQYPYRNKD